MTHTVTHTTNKLYPRKWTRDFDPWPRSADTHLTHRVSQRLCRLLPAHAPWVQRNARKDPKSTGEKLLPFRCSACLRDLSNLRHEAAHFLRGLLLHLSCGVGVGAESESGVVVTQHRGYCFDIHAVLECQGRERMSQVVEPDMLQPASLRIRLWSVTTESG